MSIKETNLTDLEKKSIKELSHRKEGLFVVGNVFSYRAWQSLQTELRDLETISDQNGRAQHFIEVLEEAYTNPSTDGDHTEQLPIVAIISLFEHSFSYFKSDVSESMKRDLADLQIRMIHDFKLPIEARNTLKGIWGYYADPERRDVGTEDERKLRGEFIASVDGLRGTRGESGDLRNRYSKDETLFLMAPHERSWSLYDENSPLREVQYFAQLYEQDVHPLVPILSDTIEHRKKIGYTEGDERHVYESTGIRMSPHERLYTFRMNRLPRILTIESGKVVMCISPDLGDQDQHIGQRREMTILVHKLPAPFLTYFVNGALAVRESNDYRSFTNDQQITARKLYEEKFSMLLINKDSELWKQITNQQLLSDDEITSVQNILDQYREGRGITPCFIIKIGEVKT